MEEKTRPNVKTILVILALAGLGLAVIACYHANASLFGKSIGAHPQGPAQKTSVTINATPGLYSPLMSSTIGIRLEPVPSGFALSDARYTWDASYGTFLDWSSPRYAVKEYGRSAVSSGVPVYWSFGAVPVTEPAGPVIVTLTATEKKSGQVLGTSRMTLAWEQNATFVRVQTIE